MRNIVCVECGSTNVIKKGTTLYRYGRVQLYKCNDCARIFNGELLEKREAN